MVPRPPASQSLDLRYPLDLCPTPSLQRGSPQLPPKHHLVPSKERKAKRNASIVNGNARPLFVSLTPFPPF